VNIRGGATLALVKKAAQAKCTGRAGFTIEC
jgi:hypothetical protein